MPRLQLCVHSDRLAVVQLDLADPLPDFAQMGPFWSLTHTADEISLVIPEKYVKQGWKAELGWKCLQVKGPLYFSMTGILASLALPLAKAKISIFTLSTYDTDYLLVKENMLAGATAVLQENGFEVVAAPPCF